MIAPRGGFYDVNGQWAVEGVGISPDIAVEQTPAEVIKGRDRNWRVPCKWIER